MVTPEFVRMMTAYNAEMNRRLYAAAANLTDEQRKQDRGLKTIKRLPANRLPEDDQ